uniref:GYF domain-containing protein n=1 Tax=Calcidiscus leptoporus TaxID=127549 RepID=A0A7S0JKN8_9EUKA|mmetsp:Transcript_7447/g.17398  ORF Transcript_7447/g.17398 Transcript_7447/m.17398 type:complete len:125 (+) Transcript_7447:3-377(+)
MMEEEFDEGAACETEEVMYYYMNDASGSARGGPCTAAQLRVLWVSGHVSSGTLMWRKGMGEWTALGALSEFHGLLQLKQPPALSEQLWYYLDGTAQRRGGMTAEQMGLMLRRGEVDGLTLVWRR